MAMRARKKRPMRSARPDRVPPTMPAILLGGR